MHTEHPDIMNGREQEHYGEQYKLLWLGELTARIIHELRNPLTALSLCLSTIEREIAKQPGLQEAVQSAQSSVERMTKIVNSTLKFIRTENTDVEPLDLRVVVQDTLPMLNSSMNKRRIAINTSFPADPFPSIQGIHSQLQQVILNIAGNGIEAIPGEGTVLITVSATQHEGMPYVALEIADTGAGIADADIKKIFSPFFTRKTNGTGLGLAIVKSILDRHNASVNVESVPGTGTKFSMLFSAIQN